MKILLGESLFKQAEPVTFEVSSKGTDHKVIYDLVNSSGAVLENQTLLSEQQKIEFDYDPSTHFKGRIILNFDFSEPHGGQYDVKLFSGTDRDTIALFQIVQHTDKHNLLMLFGLEGDDDVDAP